MAAPNFLTIHPEIRELIYIMHLTTPDTLGPTSITRANRLSQRNWLLNPDWPSTLDNKDSLGDTTFFLENSNCYPDPTINPAKPTSLSLLLVNRQIYTEVSSVIAFLTTHTKKLWYEIDCEIADESQLYPTWLHIPVRFKDVPIPYLHATFRISGRLDREVTGRSGWDHGCGGPGPMVWSLLALLNRFLKIGPNFIASKAATPAQRAVSTQQSSLQRGHFLRNRNPADIKVEKLVLEFAPSPLTREEIDARNEVALDRYMVEMIDPVNVTDFLKRELDYLFNGSKDTIEFGSFIASRVGSVHLRCDGEDVREWDLAGKEALHAKYNMQA